MPPTHRDVAVSADERWLAVGDEGLVLESSNGDDWRVVTAALSSARYATVAEHQGRWALAGSATELGIVGRTPAYLVLEESVPRASLVATPKWVEAGERSGFEVRVARGESTCESATLALRAGKWNGPDAASPLQVVASKTLALHSQGQGSELLGLDPAKQLGLKVGDRIAFSVDVECGGETATFPSHERISLLTWRPWWQQLSAWWLVPLWFVVVLATVHLLYRVAPLSLLAAWRRLENLGPAGKVNIPILGITVGDFAQVMNLWILPLHALRPRTLDAWVRKHRSSWEEDYDRASTVLRNTGYVPLPCRTASAIVERPSSDIFAQAIASGARRIDIVGEGGAGKTMLAIEMGRWLLDGRTGLARLPVLIEEDLEGDPKSALLAVIRRKLSAVIDGDALEDRLLLALLKHGRIVPIFDRLSERKESTFNAVETLHGRLRVSLAITSTRRQPEYEGCRGYRIDPLPLDSRTVMFLVAALISRRQPEHFARLGEQSDLVTRLAQMIAVPGKPDHPVTPLLVRLFVDRAMTLAAREESLEDLPTSIPAAFAAELKDMNAAEPTEAHFMPHDLMFRAARALAREAVGANFIPQEISLDKARDILRNAGWTNPAALDPVERLRLNGVVVLRDDGTRTQIAFALDPVAEFLAAESHVAEIGEDTDKLESLRRKVVSKGSPAAGFLSALEIVWLDRLRNAGAVPVAVNPPTP